MGSPGTPWLKSDVLKHPVLNTTAEKLGKTPAQVALRWGLQMGHSVLPKSTNEARIKENFDIFGWSIPAELLAKFSEIQQVTLFYSQPRVRVFFFFIHLANPSSYFFSYIFASMIIGICQLVSMPL